MGTIGSFDLNILTLGNTTNNTTEMSSLVVKEVRDQGSLIGLAIAIAIALTLIFGVVFIALNFIPKLVGKIKGLRGV